MTKRIILLAALLAMQAMVVPVAGGVILSDRWGKVIVSGIYLDGIPLEGMTLQQARQYLKERIPPADKGVLKLQAGGRVWDIALKDINAQYDLDEALDRAFSVGHSGSVIRRFTEAVGADGRSVDFLLPVRYDRELLHSEIDKINRWYKAEPANLPHSAKLHWREDRVEMIHSVTGSEIDIDATMGRLSSWPFQAGKAMPVVVRPVRPDISEKDLAGINDVIGYFNTEFDPQRVDRVHNIKLAAQSLDGILLKPGEEFSFNSTIGAISGQNGYKKATVIIGNRLTDDYGGGVCQVTTTLYNAGLKAGVEVLERYSHTVPVSYVKPGMDATVAQGFKDFRFRNSSHYAQYISCGVDTVKGNVEVWILGKADQKANGNT
ncbi:vancomycin B-type resistance protein VanW [Desulfocucumis palustris]|uniref:Vancomycin B-type resistance protein VanW n=1 Tax=Desulfocucumis palustris TaxID=1898651 RepID=A0A2L2XGA8_9FIRM|nr:VanW family protein [Desulfocucumis palustris]GBF35389.1 vancomycin B-type resistance protein VanW [Desulfocucumis palustris]